MHAPLSFQPRTRKLLRILCFFLLAACTCFIFANSLQAEDDSDERSEEVTDTLHRFGIPLPYDIVRKVAHFVEFMLLGALALLCLRIFTERTGQYLAYPLFFSLLVALADETIQLFVPGRAGLMADVWLDFAGAVTGILAAILLVRCSQPFWHAISLKREKD